MGHPRTLGFASGSQRGNMRCSRAASRTVGKFYAGFGFAGKGPPPPPPYSGVGQPSQFGHKGQGYSGQHISVSGQGGQYQSYNGTPYHLQHLQPIGGIVPGTSDVGGKGIQFSASTQLPFADSPFYPGGFSGVNNTIGHVGHSAAHSPYKEFPCIACGFAYNLVRYKWCNRCGSKFASSPTLSTPIARSPAKVLPTTYSISPPKPPIMVPPLGAPPPDVPLFSDTQVKGNASIGKGTPPIVTDFGTLGRIPSRREAYCSGNDFGLMPPAPPPLPSLPVDPTKAGNVPLYPPPPPRSGGASTMPDVVPPPPKIEPWQQAILRCPSINLHVPASWPPWFGKAIMLPKSREAAFVASLGTPPPWFVQLIKSCATLPSHITSPFVVQGECAASVEYLGEPMGREKLYGIVRDFFKVQYLPLPAEDELAAMSVAQLGELKASIISNLAATQALGPMYADLQARCVDCLNGVGDQIELANATLSKVEQQIAARALASPAPPLQSAPEPLPPKFALILSRVSKCLSAVAGSPHYCKGADVDNVRSVCSFLDTLTVNAPGLPSSAAADVLSAADAIMSLPTELQLLEDEDDPDSQASKRVRLASGSVIADSDPYGPPLVPPFPALPPLRPLPLGPCNAG